MEKFGRLLNFRNTIGGTNNLLLVILALTLLMEFSLFEYKNIAPDETFYYNIGMVMGGFVTSIVVLTIANKLMDIKMEYDKQGLIVLLGSTIIFNFFSYAGLWRNIIFIVLSLGTAILLDYLFYKKSWRWKYAAGVYLMIALAIMSQ
jgi:hypothetical protein